MTLAQKYALWGLGVILWVHGLSILLSYVAFGYLDRPVLIHMAWIISPIIGAAALLLYIFQRPAETEAPDKTFHARMLHDQRGHFFVVMNLLVGVVILMAFISVGMMLYGGLQFIAR